MVMRRRQPRHDRFRDATDAEVIRAIRSIPRHFADIAFRSFSQQDLSNPGTVTVAAPAGVAAADVCVLCFICSCTSINTVGTYTAPAGWNAMTGSPFSSSQNNKFKFHLWWALGNVSFAGTFTISGQVGTQFVGVVCAAFQNVHNTTPIDVIAGALSTTGLSANTTLSVAAVTTVTDRALPLLCCSDQGDGTFTATNYTVKENGTPPPSNQSSGVLFKTSVLTPAGSTGAVTLNDTVSGDMLGIQLALRPAVTIVDEDEGIYFQPTTWW